MVGQILQLATILGTFPFLLSGRITGSWRFELLFYHIYRQRRDVRSSFPSHPVTTTTLILHNHITHSRANLIHPKLIETTTSLYPRKSWSEHFALVIEKELTLKPWCHSTTFEVPNWKEGVKSNFATDVRGNDVMKMYDWFSSSVEKDEIGWSFDE